MGNHEQVKIKQVNGRVKVIDLIEALKHMPEDGDVSISVMDGCVPDEIWVNEYEWGTVVLIV